MLEVDGGMSGQRRNLTFSTDTNVPVKTSVEHGMKNARSLAIQLDFDGGSETGAVAEARSGKSM
jgi:hypothetical protein